MASKAWMRFSAVIVALGLLTTCLPAQAADDFVRLTELLPRSVNAIAPVDVEKALASPLSQQEGWQKDLEKAYDAGMVRTMGIRGGARQAQITSSSAGSRYAYGYRNDGYDSAAWAVPVYAAAAEMRGIDMERRKVRAEE